MNLNLLNHNPVYYPNDAGNSANPGGAGGGGGNSSEKMRKRQTQSCDRCKTKKRRCDGFNPCGNCIKADAECTMEIEQKKRGPKKYADNPAKAKSTTSSASEDHHREEQKPKKQRIMTVNEKHVGGTAVIVSNLVTNSSAHRGGEIQNTIPQPQSTANELDQLLGVPNNNSQSTFDSNSYFPNPQGSILDFDIDFAMNFTGFDLSNVVPSNTNRSMQNNIVNTNSNQVKIDLPLSQFPMKPSSFNPPGLGNTFQHQQQNNSEPLMIDPEVLALYSQLNPKMGLQSDLDMFLSSTLEGQQQPYTNTNILNGNSNSTDLTNPELIGFPTTFYIHLISMFFTYYHSSLPILDENSFLSKLVPTNNIHPMLLNTVYAIGCFYSRSPYLYQNPFYTPQKAVEYFISKALAATPPPEVWASISTKSIAICQASLLLSSIDYATKKSHTWMMVGMSIRLNQKFEMFSDRAKHSFVSFVNGINKFHVDCSSLERIRVWWGSLLVDLFLSMSTGAPLLINETDHSDTFSYSATQPPSINTGVGRLELESNPIVNQGSSYKKSDGDASDKWMPYFSGLPKDTIFGAGDANSELWARQTLGFFQVGHLFSDLEIMGYVMQITFFTRRALRLSMASSKPNIFASAANSSSSLGKSLINSLLPNNSEEVEQIHNSLLTFYENLPPSLGLWSSLQVFVSENIQDLSTYCTFTDMQPLGSLTVLLNLLYFSTLAILHQKKGSSPSLYNVCLKSTGNTSACLVTSNDVVRIAYRAQIFILRKVYGLACPPQATTIPPSAIVSSSILSTLLTIPATALLHSTPSSSPLVSKLLEGWAPNTFIPIQEQIDPTGIDSLESVLLPVLENMGQVWGGAAGGHAATLRSTMAVLAGMQLDGASGGGSAVSTPLWISNPGGTSLSAVGVQPGQPQQQQLGHVSTFAEMGGVAANTGIVGSSVQGPVVDGNGGAVIAAGDLEQGQLQLQSQTTPVVEKSWHELRDEFEDEFLL